MGRGPNLVILHGFFGSSDNWISIARKLEDKFTIYLPDLRNHGQSPHTQTHSYQDMNADLQVFFNNHKIQKASILGHSMGGKLAMMFGTCFPEKIENLVIADIAPKTYDLGDEEDKELILSLMENLDISSAATRKDIDDLLADHLKNLVLRQFLLKSIDRDDEGKFKWKINVPVLKSSLENIAHDINADFFANFKPIQSYPVTFIRGLNSDYISDDDLPAIKSIYPKAKIIDIPDAGHWLHAENQEEFVKALKSSLLQQ